MSSSLQQSAPAVDAVVSNSPVACAQAKKDAQKQRRTGGGAPLVRRLLEFLFPVNVVQINNAFATSPGRLSMLVVASACRWIRSLDSSSPSTSLPVLLIHTRPESKGRIRVLFLHLNLRGQLHVERMCSVLMHLHPMPTCRGRMVDPGSLELPPRPPPPLALRRRLLSALQAPPLPSSKK